ncbi:MAG: tetratricopeptide repeat protein [Alphaproteobacteria bacterium]|nr:tetratricopeptide repeat protein [Alphaproteobacteria bacterium]
MIRVSVLIAALTLCAPACAQRESDVAEIEDPCAAGEAALRADETETAITSFEACLESRTLDPEQEAIVHSQLGGAYLYAERWEDALREFDLAYAIAETQGTSLNSPYVRRNRGLARLRLGRLEGALSDLQAANAELPDDMLAALFLGDAYMELDRPAEAVAAFDTVTRLEPAWPSGWISRSAAFLELGMNDRAVADARRAVEAAPESGFTLNALCWALVENGQPETALPTCRQAVEAEPESGAIVHSLASALEDSGQVEEALPLFARAHELSPDSDEIREDYERTHASNP